MLEILQVVSRTTSRSYYVSRHVCFRFQYASVVSDRPDPNSLLVLLLNILKAAISSATRYYSITIRSANEFPSRSPHVCLPIPRDTDPCAEFGGIYHYSPTGDTCCADSCGVCSGPDCRDRGRNACCPWRIRDKAATCSATNPAPCKLAT